MTALSALIYERVKQATVAIAVMEPRNSGSPFDIVGTGFCVDKRGLVVTCRHVQEVTVDPSSLARLKAVVDAKESKEFDDLMAGVPFAIFYHPEVRDANVVMLPVPVMTGTTLTDFDLAMLRLHPHKAFPEGFPFLDILDYSDVQETMSIGVCGFPFGSVLQERIGTIGSSFTMGSLSSIIPIRGVPQSDVRGFQLNAAATFGNSGGPVFSTANGKVFGVLKGSVSKHYQGLNLAEPVYQIFRNNIPGRLMAFVPPAVGERPNWKGVAMPSATPNKRKKKRSGTKLVSRP